MQPTLSFMVGCKAIEEKEQSMYCQVAKISGLQEESNLRIIVKSKEGKRKFQTKLEDSRDSLVQYAYKNNAASANGPIWFLAALNSRLSRFSFNNGASGPTMKAPGCNAGVPSSSYQRWCIHGLIL